MYSKSKVEKFIRLFQDKNHYYSYRDICRILKINLSTCQAWVKKHNLQRYHQQNNSDLKKELYGIDGLKARGVFFEDGEC